MDSTVLLFVGIGLGILAKAIASLGLVLQKKAHARESTKPVKKQRPYSRNPKWIIGFLTYTFGNLITMASLALAPASIVASLDSLVLVFNMMFAPCLLHEKIRRRDLFAVFIIVVGVSCIAVGGPRSEATISGGDTLILLLIEPAYSVYAGLAGGMLVLLMLYTNVVAGRCVPITPGSSANAVAFGLIPAVLSAFLTQLSKIFGELLGQGASAWQTYHLYVFLVFLIVFNVLQVNQLQRALANFSAMAVIPVFQVSLMLLAVVGGGLYFLEFPYYDTSPLYYPILFAFGLAMAILGVVILSIREASAMDKFAKVRRRLKFLVRTHLAMRKHEGSTGHDHKHHRHQHRRRDHEDDSSSDDDSDSSDEETARAVAANRPITTAMGGLFGAVASMAVRVKRRLHEHGDDGGGSKSLKDLVPKTDSPPASTSEVPESKQVRPRQRQRTRSLSSHSTGAQSPPTAAKNRLSLQFGHQHHNHHHFQHHHHPRSRQPSKDVDELMAASARSGGSRLRAHSRSRSPFIADATVESPTKQRKRCASMLVPSTTEAKPKRRQSVSGGSRIQRSTGSPSNVVPRNSNSNHQAVPCDPKPRSMSAAVPPLVTENQRNLNKTQ